MPITRSAKKALRVSRRKRVFNDRRRRAMRNAIKEARAGATDAKAASVSLAAAYQAIDKAAKRGVIKKTTAARKKSRLARSLARTK